MNSSTKAVFVATTLGGMLALSGCGDDRSHKAKQGAHAAAAAAEDREAALFKSTARFTLVCSGRYALNHEGKTSTGTQSFTITIDPPNSVAHYSDFDADGSYDRRQRTRNNEVLPVTKVDAERIWVDDDYGFNRRTLKYDFDLGLASGVCRRAEQAGEIPRRQL